MNNIQHFSEFGLIGLTVGSLFGIIFWFLRALTRKDEQSNSFIKEILQEDRKERTIERAEHRDTTNRLANAIDELTQELRHK